MLGKKTTNIESNKQTKTNKQTNIKQRNKQMMAKCKAFEV